MSEKRKQMKKAIDQELREHKSSFYVYMVLRALTIITLVFQVFARNWESAFLAALTLIMLVIPSFLQVTLKIELPTVLEIIVLLFIFAAEILGEIQGFYVKFPFWDDLLHTLNGFLAAAVGFSLVDVLNKSEKLTFDLSPFFTVMVAFCFSMTIGAMWEIFEFSMDMIGGFDMQKDTVVTAISSVMLDPTGGNTPTAIPGITEVYVNGTALGVGGYLDIGIIDTMNDLIVNFIGAAVFSVIGYVHIKTEGMSKVVAKLKLSRKQTDES